jgi:CRP-like cAMP-binding protein
MHTYYSILASFFNAHDLLEGLCFGELALIYNSPRAASVIATSDCTLMTLDLRYITHPLNQQLNAIQHH